MTRVQIGHATLYHGDCCEVLPTLGKVDAVVADPPYGIGLEYDGYADTVENLRTLVDAFVPLALSIARVVSITPGNLNHYLYPLPTWTLCWFNRAGNGSGPWGFSCWQPILCYGPDPYLAAGMGRRPDYIEWSEGSENNGHPCPKPRKFMQRWIERVSLEGVVVDPFMGSGTTGAACAHMGRPFIGIERSAKYFDIACEQIDNATRQQRLFA